MSSISTVSSESRTAEPAALQVAELSIGYQSGPDAVSEVSFTVAAGEILGVIGESGCGKSSIGLAVLGLLPESAEVGAATLEVAGHDLVGLDEKQWRALRGDVLSIIFQEPMSALNPVLRLGDQIAEVLLLHESIDRKEARQQALELLRRVQVPEPELRMRQFPHQISGGMRQRVMIAMAMAARPRLLVADEPTTALDVTIQAQILQLLMKMRDETGVGVVLISHDLGVIANTCDRVLVMYAGQVVEEGTPHQVLSAPAHPYTKALLASTPTLDIAPRAPLPAIAGSIQPADRGRTGCRFEPRCDFAVPGCGEPQRLAEASDSRPAQPHRTRCWRSAEVCAPQVRPDRDAELALMHDLEEHR